MLGPLVGNLVSRTNKAAVVCTRRRAISGLETRTTVRVPALSLSLLGLRGAFIKVPQWSY